MLKKLSTIYLFILPLLLLAQNQANNWYFGDKAGLNFNTGVPIALTDGELFTIEGCSTISDNSGNLLFYSNGIDVWDRNHNIMPNGSGLLGDISSTQSGIIVPYPNNSNLYYIFSLDHISGQNGLRYSVVNMGLNGGLGEVTAEKNILLHTPSTEKITAVTHANGNDIWVITHKAFTNEFYSYLITNTGINLTPIITPIGHTPTTINDAAAAMKVSPDGTKLAIAYYDAGIFELLDFDTASGVLSNSMEFSGFSIPWQSESYIYGVEFSPNNQLLYISDVNVGIYQYNITSNNQALIDASKILVTPDFVETSIQFQHCSLQLAPDGKIYVGHNNYEYLGVINNPDVQGNSCDYVFNGIYLEGKLSRLGLPPFIQSYFSVGFQSNNPCLGQTANFSANITQAYDSLIWDFGDGNTSTDESPTHTYAVAGEYEVSLSVTAGAENSIDSKTITVYELPVVTPLVELRQCDDDLDGFTSFNLTEANAEISVNYLNETITYFESQLDAENESDAILNITDYINQVVSVDTIWARVENSNGCYAISQINLIVSTTQIQLSFLRDFYQCDDGTDTTDGIATFNFSAINNEIEALFPAGQQLTITYYRTIADALAEVNAITDISNYQNIGYPNTQDIYVRVDSALDNDCLGLGHHITLHVEAIPIANTVTMADQCDADGDGLFAFDTSSIETTLLNGQTNFSVSYTDELGNPLSSPLPNPFNTTSQTITARVTNATSQDADGACYDETPIVFTVDAAAVAHSVTDIIVCDDAINDGQVDFDTSTIETTVLNGQSGMLVSYFDEDYTVLPSPLPNPFSSLTQSITVRVENQLSAACYDETTINFIVSAQPTANAVADDFVCDDLSNDGWHSFTLSTYNAEVLNGQSASLFEVLYFETLIDVQNNSNSLPNSYVVNVTSQTIYARIQNRNNIDCFDIIDFQLGVHYLPIAHQSEDFLTCDDASNDGIETFDLSLQNTAILNGQLATDNRVSYYITLEDAESNTNPLGTDFTNTQNPQTIYARLENTNFPECYTTTSFQLLVKEQPVLFMDDETSICDGDIVELIADAGYDYYNWSTGATTRSITVDEIGQYTVAVSNIYGDLTCVTEKTITVTESNVATITAIETVDWTQNDNVISVFVEGNGDYEYSIDGFTFQDSNVFTNLSIAEYEVFVRDKKGCGSISETIYLLYYPKFFTPNDDGVNDYWQIINAAKEPNNTLFIYNRYGKLLTQLRPSDSGWDGTFNGNRLPSSDYWFVLQRQNGKTHTGHFTLKR